MNYEALEKGINKLHFKEEPAPIKTVNNWKITLDTKEFQRFERKRTSPTSHLAEPNPILSDEELHQVFSQGLIANWSSNFNIVTITFTNAGTSLIDELTKYGQIYDLNKTLRLWPYLVIYYPLEKEVVCSFKACKMVNA